MAILSNLPLNHFLFGWATNFEQKISKCLSKNILLIVVVNYNSINHSCNFWEFIFCFKLNHHYLGLVFSIYFDVLLKNAPWFHAMSKLQVIYIIGFLKQNIINVGKTC